jgi:hypothetical protein
MKSSSPVPPPDEWFPAVHSTEAFFSTSSFNLPEHLRVLLCKRLFDTLKGAESRKEGMK